MTREVVATLVVVAVCLAIGTAAVIVLSATLTAPPGPIPADRPTPAHSAVTR